MGYHTLKGVAEMAIQRSNYEQMAYIGCHNHLLKNPDMAIFINETHKSENMYRRRMHWGLKGKASKRHTQFGEEFDPWYTMIAAAQILVDL